MSVFRPIYMVLFGRANLPTAMRMISTVSHQSTDVVNPEPTPAPLISTRRSKCVIRGLNEDIFFPEEEFVPIAEYIKLSPPVTTVTPTGVVVPDPHRDLQISNHWRQLLWSGFIHSHICKVRRDSIVGAFRPDNVGVLKSLNLLAFKQFARDAVTINSTHLEYAAFVTYCLTNMHPTALDQLVEWVSFLADLSKEPENLLLHNPIFLQDIDIAHLFVDIHRLLRHEFGLRGLSKQATLIMTEIENLYPNHSALNTCQMHFLLNHLTGKHGKKRANPPQSGSVVIDVHRIAMSHSIEINLEANVLKVNPAFDLKILRSYERVELIQQLRYLFPKYAQTAAKEFNKNGVWERLNMERRLWIPSIYHYSLPKPKTILHNDGAED